MITQLAIGSLVIALSIVVHVAFLVSAIVVLRRKGESLASGRRLFTLMMTLVLTTLWLMAAHSISVWIWSAAFLLTGTFDALEPAVYFSLVAFTTLGFGDIILGEEWRILSGMAAANGLLLFGFSTAFLIDLFAKILKAQDRALGRTTPAAEP
jgi:hypothetical protein